MRRVGTLFLLTVAGLVAGCSSTPTYTITDVQSRHGYQCIGDPNFLSNGAITFKDSQTGKGVVLQSYEIAGPKGESYIVQRNSVSGAQELVPVK